jgi:hypothetical protein
MHFRLTFAPSLAAVAAALATPAFAHHMGPSGVGAGGGMTVFAPATLDEGHGSAWLRLFFTQPDRRSDSLLEALAGEGVDAHNTRYDLNGAAGAAFGITHRLTVSAELPYLRHDSIRVAEAGDGVERLGSVAGIGDLSLLAKYRLTPGEAGGLAIIGGIKAPTGSTNKRDRFGDRLETEHQPGTGSWDPIFGASAGAKAGQVNVAASAVYQLAGRGAQHTRLGDRLQAGIALSHHFGPSEDEEHHHHVHEHEPHEHASSWDAFVELAGEWEGRQRIGGEVEQDSGGKWAWVAPGVSFNAASGWSASVAIAVPVWQRIRPSHTDNAYRVMISVGHGF